MCLISALIWITAALTPLGNRSVRGLEHENPPPMPKHRWLSITPVPCNQVGHDVLDGFDHVSAVGRLAAGGLRRRQERGHAVIGDHIADEHVGAVSAGAAVATAGSTGCVG